jgi:hypothetical protein
MPFGSRTVKRKWLSPALRLSLWRTRKPEKNFFHGSFPRKAPERPGINQYGQCFFLEKLLTSFWESNKIYKFRAVLADEWGARLA